MLMIDYRWLIALGIAAILNGSGGELHAQCSRGGGGPTGSARGLAMASTGPSMTLTSAGQSAFSNPSLLAMQRQNFQLQQERLEMRQRMIRQSALAASQQQQDLLAMRRARADQKRARRAARIARAMEQRAAEQETTADGGRSLFADQPTPVEVESRLASATKPSPFTW